MRIITNRLKANINYDAMLGQYTFFLVTLVDAQNNHMSIYAALEDMLTSQKGCTVVAFDSEHRPQNEEKKYKRTYVVACSKESHVKKGDICEVLSDNCEIEDADEFRLKRKVPNNQLLNVFLAMLPNKHNSVLYAHGKYLIGGCKDWNTKFSKRGELIFLHVYIDKACCLQSRVQTLTKETQFKNKNKIKGKTPYYLSFDEHDRVYLSTKAQVDDDSKFYDIKPYGREDQKNLLPFLCYKDTEDFKQCQAYVLNDVVDQMNESYESFMTIETNSYKPSDTFVDKSVFNEKEDQYVIDFKKNHNIKVASLDEVDPVIYKLSSKIESLLKDVGCENKVGKKDAVIRVVPSLEKDEKLKKEERNEEKIRQSISKLTFHNENIPVQDVTIDHMDINKDTMKNLIRQLAVKSFCLNKQLPNYIAKHFDGCTVVYGEQNNGSYEIVTIEIDDEDLRFSFDSAADDGNKPYVESLGISVDLQRLGKQGKRDSFFLIKKGSVLYHIINTAEIVMPEIENMKEELEKRDAIVIPVCEYEQLLSLVSDNVDAMALCKQRLKGGNPIKRSIFEEDCKQLKHVSKEVENFLKTIRKRADYTAVPNFKNKENIASSLSAYTNIAYWQEPDADGSHWCYSVGSKSQGFGTKTEFLHKTHIHHVFTTAPVSKDEFQSLIIDSLHDGWLRINEFSVEPSIFKFAAEALEIHRTEMYANGYEFVKK